MSLWIKRWVERVLLLLNVFPHCGHWNREKVRTKECVVQGSAKCPTIQTIFKPNHQNGMKTMMYDVSQVVSYSGMMKGKGILLRYNCPSLHITPNIVLGPIYLNLDLGLSN